MESFPDLAEEVIREYGYDHIVPTFLNTAAVTNGGPNYEQKQQLKTKRLLAAQGFYEASTLAFYSNAEFDMLHIPAEDEARKAIRIPEPHQREPVRHAHPAGTLHAERHHGQPQEGQR